MATYIHLSSDDCKTTHPNNTPYSFTVDLPTVLPTRCGEWELALSSIQVSQGKLPKVFNVFCDVVEQSIIKEDRLPVLRQATQAQFFRLMFIKVVTPELSTIRITLTDINLQPLVKLEGTVTCTLWLRKRHTMMGGKSCLD